MRFSGSKTRIRTIASKLTDANRLDGKCSKKAGARNQQRYAGKEAQRAIWGKGPYQVHMKRWSQIRAGTGEVKDGGCQRWVTEKMVCLLVPTRHTEVLSYPHYLLFS